MKNIFLTFMILCVTSGCLASRAYAQEETLTYNILATYPEHPPCVLRSNESRCRYISFLRMNAIMFPDGTPRPLNSVPVNINLFPDAQYTAVFDSVTPNDNGYTWYGHYAGVQYSSFYIVYLNGIELCQFSSPSGVYEVSQGDGAYHLGQLNQIPGEHKPRANVLDRESTKKQ